MLMLEDMQSIIIELSMDELELSDDVGHAIDKNIELSAPDELVWVSWARPGTVVAAMPPAKQGP